MLITTLIIFLHFNSIVQNVMFEINNLPYDNQPFARHHFHVREWISSFRHVAEHWNDEHIEQQTKHL